MQISKAVDFEVYRPVYNALLDASMVTCRSLWELLGVTVPSLSEKNPASPTVAAEFSSWIKYIKPKLPPGIEIWKFDERQFNDLPEKKEIVLVLVAANKCVAHLDAYADHGVGDAQMDSAIEATLREVGNRIRNRQP
jgi:hypothetical protein